MIKGREELAVMDYIKVHDYYSCPWCNSEFWPGSKKKGVVTSADAMGALTDEVRRQNQMRKKGASSRNAGRKRKKKLAAQAWWVRE